MTTQSVRSPLPLNQMSNSYIKCLDGLRAIAVLLVMTFHAHITHFGWVGVQMFFVLSGFLITGILWKEKSRPEAPGPKFKKFWIRRSLRIFPLYYLYLGIMTLSFLLVNIPEYYLTYIPYLLTYTFNYVLAAPVFFGQEWHGNPFYTHLWSLAIEEQFYLVFPFIILLGSRRFIRYFMITIVLLSPLIRLFLFYYYREQGVADGMMAITIYWNALSHLDAFFIGGLIPVLALDGHIKKPARLFSILLAVFFIAGLFNFLTTESGKFYFNDLGYNQGPLNNYQFVWQYTVLNLLFASLILCLISKHSGRYFQKIRTLLENNWMVRVGKVSYGMYIFHWIILAYIYAPYIHSENLLVKILLFIPYAILVYGVAQFSYTFFESYFIRLKDALYMKKAPKTQPG